jgi:hypothetical protein
VNRLNSESGAILNHGCKRNLTWFSIAKIDGSLELTCIELWSPSTAKMAIQVAGLLIRPVGH